MDTVLWWPFSRTGTRALLSHGPGKSRGMMEHDLGERQANQVSCQRRMIQQPGVCWKQFKNEDLSLVFWRVCVHGDSAVWKFISVPKAVLPLSNPSIHRSTIQKLQRSSKNQMLFCSVAESKLLKCGRNICLGSFWKLSLGPNLSANA